MIRANQKNRLSNLRNQGSLSRDSEKHTAFDKGEYLKKLLRDIESQKKLEERLTLAAYITISEQNGIKKIRLWFILLFSISVALFFLIVSGLLGGIIGFIGASYMATVVFFLWIAYRKNDSIRSIYYELPLVLEELVLLVESGLSLFPALEEVCNSSNKTGKNNTIVRKTLRSAYLLASNGLPVSQAFELVAKVCPFSPLRHVLLHLDISSNVGGELLHSLRTLSEQVNQEWKLAVETRIKKLENLVVFPVFASVIGLMILTAAVPLVPVLDYMSSMGKRDTPDVMNQSNFSSGVINNFSGDIPVDQNTQTFRNEGL